MNSLIITAGNAKYFDQLRNFVLSLRTQGEFEGLIVVCDNAISGTWNNPGTWSKEESFQPQHLNFFKEYKVRVIPIQQLIDENQLPEQTIRNIKSPTQRYPYKFIYNTLISKKFSSDVEQILYFDSDIYFQAPVKRFFEQVEAGKILIVQEWKRIGESKYLKEWIRYSDFSRVSSQDDFLSTMLPAEDFCSGFYGGDVITFHRFNLLALLLTSNQFVNFYSDQPLVNILKTFFFYPFKELDFSYCLHLGDLKANEYGTEGKVFVKDGVVPICVHFNSGKYKELEYLLKSGERLPIEKLPLLRRLKNSLRRIIS